MLSDSEDDSIDLLLQHHKSSTITVIGGNDVKTNNKVAVSKNNPKQLAGSSSCRTGSRESIELLQSSDDDNDDNDTKPAAKTNNSMPQNVNSLARKTTTQPFHLDDDSDDSESSLEEYRKVLQRRTANLLKSNTAATTKKTTTTAITQKKTTTTTKLNLTKSNKEEIERQRLEKKRQKEMEKEAAKQDRLEQRQAKLAAVQAAKDQRKRKVQESKQQSGKLAKDEIAVLLHQQKIHKCILGDLKEAGYTLHDYPSALGCNVIQWIRKEALQGGAQAAIQALQEGRVVDYQHLKVVGIVMDDPMDFIKLLQRSEHEEDDDYPDLEDFIHGVEFGWFAAWKSNLQQQEQSSQRPRIIIFLSNVLSTLDRMWVDYRKKNKSRRNSAEYAAPPPTAEELHDAITWMLIQFQVECVHCSAEDISNHICKMTRMLAEEPYQKQVTELECIKKLKAEVSDMDPALDRSKDVWKRQVQQIPRVSQRMAANLVEYYPTAMSLWQAYQDPCLGDDEKRVLVADCFNDQSRQVKLSDWVYRVLTSNDPDEILR